MADGTSLAAFAITEEEAGSDVASMTTTRAPRRRRWVLDGAKTFISNAGVAGHYVVFANADPSLGRRGITAFIVRPDDPGFVFAGELPMMADHPLGTIRFEGCRLAGDRLLGDVGAGFKIAMSTLDVFRSTVGAAALGMARRALDEALSRVTSRQAVRQGARGVPDGAGRTSRRWPRSSTPRACSSTARRTRRTAGRPASRSRPSMGKMYATEAAQRIIDRALQLHGGTGVVRGNAVERLYREVRALRIYEGTTEIQRLVIATQLLAEHSAKT